MEDFLQLLMMVQSQHHNTLCGAGGDGGGASGTSSGSVKVSLPTCMGMCNRGITPLYSDPWVAKVAGLETTVDLE